MPAGILYPFFNHGLFSVHNPFSLQSLSLFFSLFKKSLFLFFSLFKNPLSLFVKKYPVNFSGLLFLSESTTDRKIIIPFNLRIQY